MLASYFHSQDTPLFFLYLKQNRNNEINIKHRSSSLIPAKLLLTKSIQVTVSFYNNSLHCECINNNRAKLIFEPLVIYKNYIFGDLWA